MRAGVVAFLHRSFVTTLLGTNFHGLRLVHFALSKMKLAIYKTMKKSPLMEKSYSIAALKLG